MLPDDTVCFCYEVTESEIRDVIRQFGLKSVHEISQRLDACLGCRTCRIDIEAILCDVWGDDWEDTPPGEQNEPSPFL